MAKEYSKHDAITDLNYWEREFIKRWTERANAKNDRIIGEGYADRQIADTLSKVEPIDVHISKIGKNMDALIKRGHAVEILADYFPENRAEMIETFAAILDQIPEVNTKERRGQWIRDHDLTLRAPGLQRFFCSCCYNYHDTRSNYCPNCGANMKRR